MAPPAPRILFLARCCNVPGIMEEIQSRASECFFSPDRGNDPTPTGMKRFSYRAAWALRRRVRAGEFDLVVSFHNPEPIWRQDRNLISNLLKFTRRAVGRPYSMGFYLLPWILRDSTVPLAVYDWEDNTIIPRRSMGLLRRATCYFKTQCPRNPYKAFLFQDKRNDCIFNIVRQPVYTGLALRIRPISIGVKEPALGSSALPPEKKTDIFFAGTAHYSWARLEGLKLLEQLRDEGFKVDLHVAGRGVAPIPQEDFLRRCAEAWLVWSPEGAGWECTRHYAAPLMGSVPLLNDPDSRRYQPLRDGEHAFYYSVEEDDLKRVARRALSDKEKLRTMAAEAATFVRPRHMPGPLIDYLIDETLRTARG